MGRRDDRPHPARASRAPPVDAGRDRRAPELNPHFRHLVSSARRTGVRVIDRCNLTILNEPGFEDLADYLASERVEITASLPCYTKDNVDRQRGTDVFDSSILGLRKLNALGYGCDGSGLVAEPRVQPGRRVPAASAGEAAGRLQARARRATSALRSTRCSRWPTCRSRASARRLISQGKFAAYMALLRNAHNPANLDGVMCRTLVSVDWRGFPVRLRLQPNARDSAAHRGQA